MTSKKTGLKAVDSLVQYKMEGKFMLIPFAQLSIIFLLVYLEST